MKIEHKTIKQLHQIKLYQRLTDLCKDNFEAKHTITGALRITCNKNQADLQLKTSTLPFSNNKITFSENNPNEKQSQGLIRGILIYYNDEELKEAFSSFNVTNIRRFVRNQNGITMPTETVLLTFKRGEQLFKQIYLGMQLLKVTEYIPTAQRCNNCQLYGHTGTICAKPPKCAKCGSKHKINDCRTQLIADKCVNCGGRIRKAAELKFKSFPNETNYMALKEIKANVRKIIRQTKRTS